MSSDEPLGVVCLIPTVLVFVLAVWTHRPIESLLSGVIVGLVMLNGIEFVPALAEVSLTVLTDSDVAWVILVCGLMGSLIALLLRIGATRSFTETISNRVSDARGALMATWALGIALFVDDYLNSLAAGAAMRDVTDKFRVAREKLAYVIDSTAAPISVLIPFSTWGAFFAGLIVANDLAAEGEGLRTYISAIPYMFYPWLAAIIVPLVVYGVIPSLGAMASADARAQSTGLCVPPEAQYIEDANRSLAPKHDTFAGLGFFILPMACLVTVTVYADNDFLVGVYVALGVTAAAILVRRLLDLRETTETILEGFKTMLEPLTVLVAAFMLKEVNDDLGLASYIVDGLSPLLSAELLPAAMFVTMAAVSFFTGSNWGVFVIALPIVATLGRELGTDMTLLIGATLSASTFGSHACFYSDATVLTAQASGCTPFQHAWTQIPYALIAASISFIAYLVIGFAL
ncbi:MAG: Na+/H+ antiporter NhaC family protein [Pseudomonadota bacterium]